MDYSGDEDSSGEPVAHVLETFEVDAAGSLHPDPSSISQDYRDVRTEDDLRRHYGISSFVSVEAVEP